jgi:hypothetical protein
VLQHLTMKQQTRSIRISLDLYDRLVNASKKDQTFADILDKIFSDNHLLPVVMEENKK